MQPSIHPSSSGSDDTLTSVETTLETFRIRKGLAGWYILPENPRRHPLLARLFGESTVCANAQDLRAPQPWATLEAGLSLIREVARDAGICVRVCGRIKQAPTVQLWRRRAAAVVAPAYVFERLRGDAAKWGVSDFYPANEIALRKVLESRVPFDTGWYSVKKDLQSGRIQRVRSGGQLTVEVTMSIDEWDALVDTAVWSCRGEELEAQDGFDVLTRLGLTENEAQAWLSDLAASEASYSELGEGNSWQGQTTLSGRVGYARLVEALDELATQGERELHAVFEACVEQCKASLAKLRES